MTDLATIEQEAVADGKAFIATAEADVKAIASASWNWLLAELEKIEPTVLAQVKSAINEVATDLEEGETAGVALADVLTVLARDGLEDVMAIKTDVLSALIGLTTASPGNGTTAAEAA